MPSMIMNAFVWVPVAIVVALLMDFWAALLHGKVWHRWLWNIHVTHHSSRKGRFETNDALSFLHAPIAIALTLYGCRANPGVLREVAFGAGIGMTIFGVAYVIVHDGLVHGRLPVKALRRVRYLDTVARAHRVHHAGVFGGPPYGLFFGHWELARAKRERERDHAAAQSDRSTPSPHTPAMRGPRPRTTSPQTRG